MNAEDKIELQDVTEAGALDVIRDVGMDEKCGKCTKSICCNSINQKVPTPKTVEDFDHLLWQVAHENVNLFRDADGWFLHINTRCSHLLPGGICGIYEKRPWVCREYSNEDCEYDEPIEEASEKYFYTYEQLNKYCKKRFKRWEKRFKDYE